MGHEQRGLRHGIDLKLNIWAHLRWIFLGPLVPQSVGPRQATSRHNTMRGVCTATLPIRVWDMEAFLCNMLWAEAHRKIDDAE